MGINDENLEKVKDLFEISAWDTNNIGFKQDIFLSVNFTPYYRKETLDKFSENPNIPITPTNIQMAFHPNQILQYRLFHTPKNGRNGQIIRKISSFQTNLRTLFINPMPNPYTPSSSEYAILTNMNRNYGFTKCQIVTEKFIFCNIVSPGDTSFFHQSLNDLVVIDRRNNKLVRTFKKCV